MLKKTLAIILVILTLFISSACTYFENTLYVSYDTESEAVESESLSSESESESEVITVGSTNDTTDTANTTDTTDSVDTIGTEKSNLISDEEAIELFEIGNRTSNAWRGFDIWPDINSDDYIMYKSPRRTEPEKYYPLSPESYVRLSAPDIRGNTEIYYGNHDWMQENLARIFTKSFIEKHFTYGDPSPLIYQDGIVYIYPSGGSGYYSGRHMNHKILERSENELAIMCEVYRYDFDIFDINYSEIDRLLYMKFVKDGDNWLIDEHYSDYPCPVPAQDPIPAEYDWAYKKYYEIMPYCEMWYYFEKPEEDTAFDESKIIGTFKCVGKHYNGEFYKQEPEITPQLSFYEDGSCRLLMGHNSEELYINGEYTISGREINVVFVTENTPYSNPTGKDECSFYFKEDNLIEINSNFYGDDIKRGYGFVKFDNINETDSSEDTADTKSDDGTDLISDKEAIELFNKAEYTSREWLSFNIDMRYELEEEPIYREYTDSKLMPYYPLTKESCAGLSRGDEDIRGNTRIYYGNHDWMQKNLRKIFSEKYIEKYFSYGYPSPLIYENGVVYSTPPTSTVALGATPKTYKNHTIIHKTEDELAIICEVYKYNYVLQDYDYSQIDGLAYMKLVKVGSVWLIDEHYSAKDTLIMPNDCIPAKYFENIPEKYRSMTKYFEGYADDTSVGTSEFDPVAFENLNCKVEGGDGKPYMTMDDILEFDNNAQFIGPTRTFSVSGAKYSGFEMRNTNCSLWGYEGFVEYTGRIKEDSENIIAKENAMYGTIYEYTGDGSDILFDPEVIFTIPNVTYNDYVYIKQKVWEFYYGETSENSQSQSVPGIIVKMKALYGADTILTKSNFTTNDYIGKITLCLIDENTLAGSQNEGLALNPLPIRIYNRLKIYFSR